MEHDQPEIHTGSSLNLNNSNLLQTEQIIQREHKPKKIYHFLFILFFAVVTLMGISFWALQKAPDVRAQVYLNSVGNSFLSFKHELDFYKGSFTGISESLSVSKESFYEIITSRDYFSAVEDTRNDIEDIERTLNLITQTIDSRTRLDVPEELSSFDEKLAHYYVKSQQALNLLLNFENYQMMMLEASGDDLNKELKKLDNLVKNSNAVELQETISNLVILSEEAAVRFKNLDNLPETELSYYETMREYNEDLAITMKKLESYLLMNNQAGDYQFALEVVNFSQRNNARNKARQQATEEIVESSIIKTLFVEIDTMEKEIADELDMLLKKYDVEIVYPIITPVIETPDNPEPAQQEISPTEASDSAFSTSAESVSPTTTPTPVSPSPETSLENISPFETSGSATVTP